MPLKVALVEGNETLHTSHLQCHIFIPLLSLPLPPSLSQHTTICKGKCLLSVLHLSVSLFVLLSLARPVVHPPLVLLSLCSVPSLSLPPLPLLTPSASLLTWPARPITLLLFPLPSLWKRDKPLTACIALYYPFISLALSLLDLKLVSSRNFFLGFHNLIISCSTGSANLPFWR